MEVYLDNSATTRVSDGVKEEMLAVLTQEYGNPSSLHTKGARAEQLLRTAQKRIAASLRVEESTIYFTSGGTESNNLALIGGAMAKKRRGMHLITSSVEHPSVSATMDYLEEQGFSVTRLPVDRQGLVDPAALLSALRPDTVLVSVMLVNNELGARQPIEELVRLVKEHDPQTLFHADAVQGYGKLPLAPKRLGIDLLSASGHKIHGPKGVGFLYVADKVRLVPLIHGGQQQKGLRSGTENMPGIVGLGRAAEDACRNLAADMDRVYALKERLQQGFEGLPGVTVNGPRDRALSAPHIVSGSFEGVRSEVLLHSLEERGIYVSAGSACSSHKREMSPVLKAAGFTPAQAESTLRFSLSSYTTEEEIDYTLKTLEELLPLLRRFTRR